MFYPFTRTCFTATCLAALFFLLLTATDGLTSPISDAPPSDSPDGHDNHDDDMDRLRPGFGALPPLWSTGATHHVTTGQAWGNLTLAARLAAFGHDVAQASLTRQSSVDRQGDAMTWQGQERYQRDRQRLWMRKKKDEAQDVRAYGMLTLDGTEGCNASLLPPPTTSMPSIRKDVVARQPWILLQRGRCAFVDKVRHAQHIGYAGVLVGDDGSSLGTLVTMFAKGAEDIDIASLFITHASFKALMELAGQSDDDDNMDVRQGYVKAIPIEIAAVALRTDWPLLDTLVFICFSPLCTLLAVYIILFLRRRKLRRDAILPPAYLARLEHIAYLPKEGRLSSCVICLDSFEDDCDVLALPCGHIYHPACITRWLVERKRTCPICKRDVRATLDGQTEDAASDLERGVAEMSVDERTPLLQSMPASVQGTTTRPVTATATTQTPR